ncbi:MAG: tetratricopeptide repeat protein [Phycisphaerales bacterium]
MRRGTRTIVLAALAGLALGAMHGCEGHGKYTSAFKEEALANQASIRSATEWDAANQAYHAGELDRALGHIERSIALKGDVVRAHLLHARILLEKGDADAAFAAIENGVAVNPDVADLYYYRAVLHERLGEHTAAYEDYTRAMERDTSSVQFVIASSEALVSMGRLDDAEALLVEKSRRFGSSAGIKQALGHIALMKDDLYAASTLFAEAKVLDPRSATIDEDLARVLIEQSRFAEAEFTLRELLSRPSHTHRRDLKLLHARTLIETDEPVEAREILLALADQRTGSGGDARVWSHLIDVALILGDDRLLERASSRLIAVAPKQAEGYLGRALLERKQGRIADALASAELASSRSGGDRRAEALRALLARDLADVSR